MTRPKRLMTLPLCRNLTLALVAAGALSLLPAVAHAKKTPVRGYAPRAEEQQLADHLLSTLGNRRLLSDAAWPDLVRTRPGKGMRAFGTFSPSMELSFVRVESGRRDNKGSLVEGRAVLFSKTGAHLQTTLFKRGTASQSIRTLRHGKWLHTTVRYDSGHTMHYSPGAPPRRGMNAPRRR